MNKGNLIIKNSCGLYCKQGDFYIDPWKPVERALITHAHSDHARWGSKKYLSSKQSENILRIRLGENINLQTLNYGEEINLNGAKVSFYPAGHILGSSQIRVEFKGEVWVISGDYKTEADSTCGKFEPLKCNTFITESTFSLPIYKWCPQEEVFQDINNWWQKNKEHKKTNIIYCYALGKAQRLIAGLDKSIGAIYTHGAVENMNIAYRNSGVNLPETVYVNEVKDKNQFIGAMVVAPPSSEMWVSKFPNISTAFVSGWMQIRGNRRRRSVDRGFVLSDHADWNGLINTIKETDAQKIYVTHGYSPVFVRWLCENGWDAEVIQTRFEGELDSGE